MDLSILIPARNEQFLARTIEDVLKNLRGDTEVIAVLDGAWAEPPIADHPRVTLIRYPQSIGQRAATNAAARMSEAVFVMKLDAHCALDEGFDVKLMAPYASGELGPDVTSVARMYNLHAFDWRCTRCDRRTYQGPQPTGCETCGVETPHEMVMVWQPRRSRQSDFMRFDNTLHFKYWGAYKHRPGTQGELAETMSLLGACWMMRRDRYWELGGLDENHGSWGQMGTEIACQTWLSGGRLVVNKRTWFSHLFRTQTGFGFPYPNPGADKARAYSRHLWMEGNWPKAKYSLVWLLRKFWPVPEWTEEELARLARREPQAEVSRQRSAVSGPTKGLVFYTDNRLEDRIARAVQAQLLRCQNGNRLVSVSLKPLEFGENIVLPLERGILTMFRQILAGLEALDTDIAFLVEHDILYDPSHFDFVPPRTDVFYYNQAVFKVDAATGKALYYHVNQTSGLCAYRVLLVEHYRKRVERVEREGFTRSMGFEPGTHRYPRGVDDYGHDTWRSAVPNIDIRHRHNLTPSRWSKSEFRNQRFTSGWTEADGVPVWGTTLGRFDQILRHVMTGFDKTEKVV